MNLLNLLHLLHFSNINWTCQLQNSNSELNECFNEKEMILILSTILDRNPIKLVSLNPCFKNDSIYNRKVGTTCATIC